MRASLFLHAALGVCALALAPGARADRTATHDYEVPVPGSYELPAVKPAADGAVLDSAGQARRLRDLTRGKVTVMSFIYTRCADATACPLATGVLRQLHAASAEDHGLAAGLRLISMSFDPETDDPERMAGYARVADVPPPAAEWQFLTTASSAAVEPILADYDQAVDRKAEPRAPTGPLNHSVRVYLIDRTGMIRNIYSSATLDARLILTDIRTLLLESQRSAAR